MPVVTLNFSNSVTRDTYVSEANPTTSYAGNTNLNVGTGPSTLTKNRALLFFDLGLIPNNAIINAATLNIYGGAGNARQINLHKVTSQWDNSTNWSTQPTFDPVATASFTRLAAGGNHAVDAKNLVQDWANGAPNYGLLLKNADESVINTVDSFNSFDYSTNKPTLTIDYTIPSTGKKQVEFVGAMATIPASPNTSTPLDLPAGIQQGDLLIAQVAKKDTSTAIGGMTGWTKISEGIVSGSNFRHGIYYKFATASESRPTMTSGVSAQLQGMIWAFRNVKAVRETVSSAFSGNISNPPNATTVYDKTLLLVLSAINQFTTASPYSLGMQELSEASSSASTMAFHGMAKYMYLNKTATGSTDMQVLWGTSGTGEARAIFLEPIVNNPPTLTLTSPTDNQTLTEGATYTLAGTVSDPDNGNAVTVKYAINGGTARNITSAISDGVSPIPFSKALTFQNGRLYDGATDVSGHLAENTTYTVNVYAVDDQGGTSTSYTRSFAVILNRPPNIVLDAYSANRTGLSELERLTFTGTLTDPENDTISLTAAFNGGDPVPLKAGVPSGTTFEYAIPVSALVNGTNTVIFTATDTKGAAKTKTLTFAKSGTQTPVKTAVVRYAITPPLGTTAEIVTWVNREAGDLIVAAARSVVASNAAESFVAMTKNASVPIGDGTIYEDEFVGTATPAGAKVTLKLTLTRTDSASTKAIKKIMGGIG